MLGNAGLLAGRRRYGSDHRYRLGLPDYLTGDITGRPYPTVSAYGSTLGS
jgi:hypothetical protein